MSSSVPLRIANCSGFFGDRLAAAREMIDGGPIDVLTGDWLAELTMGVLSDQQSRHPEAGYARTFLVQVNEVLGTCLQRGIKIVSNAGGLNPIACASEVELIGNRLGLELQVAVVDGDDAREVFRRRRGEGWTAPHLDTGQPFPLDVDPRAVNAYLGGWGIVEALSAGADVVVTGRVTDAALVLGPAAWHFGWARDNWDALAGSVAAGHVIECGAQATGGNFSFFDEVPGLSRAGFPIAEVYEDGSAVITKHPGTGGVVTVETVTAQLLYEVDGPHYINPDVIARMDTARLEQIDIDRVQISGVRGEPAPESLKIGALAFGGWRNEVTFVLTGDSIEGKAALAQSALWEAIPGGESAFESVAVRLLRADRPNPSTMNDAVALLTVTVSASDKQAVATFSRTAVETGLASYPGLYFMTSPTPARAYSIFWPTLLPAELFRQRITLGDRSWYVPSTSILMAPVHVEAPSSPRSDSTAHRTLRAPLGRVLGSRSGDKAGNAILGVWARSDLGYAWLRSWWNEEQLRELLIETGDLELRLWELPLLRACGVTIVGFLGFGVAANLDLDSQGKGLGEYFRAKHFEIPLTLLRLADKSAR